MSTPPTAVPPWAASLALLMDDAFAIPGTQRRFGLDALLGFVAPGLGDAVSAVSGLILIVVAFGVHVPGVVLLRMALNVAIDALVGAVPLIGDVFDLGWKSNRRNLALIERFQRPHARATLGDYLFVMGSVASVLVALLLPLLAIGWVIAQIAHTPR